jgi:zinc transporter 7
MVLISECFFTSPSKTGGLLSDVFLHLIPHAFMGESQAPGVHFLIVEEKRNILIG